MPNTCRLSIITDVPNSRLDFGTVFNNCLKAFEKVGAYTDLTLSKEKFIATTINLQFCQTVTGTIYGHYGIFVPEFDNKTGYIHRNPFFHLSTDKDDNISNTDTEFSITLENDEHGQSFLIQIAICILQHGYRVFFTQDTTKSNNPLELSKKDVAQQIIKARVHNS